ncbi:MAG TPA: 1-deoxy-D-xylulose-5-phosphate reductoisomerase [Acholeplasmataceae bacterium]|jgi:1-deoxy-D-xylulose-5-phosphate reductoisomerase|nr:1-deoxy-D-xylulose-5-phosphate reductoisomerase [Acholeplasmataceae bacterium]
MAGNIKNVYILGAGGSIGLQTLEILENNPDFKVIGLSLSRNDSINHTILSHFTPEICALRTQQQMDEYPKLYPNIKFVCGDHGLIEVATYPKRGLLINALSGSIGLKSTVEAIKSGKDIGLANKETLVMAGPIIKELVVKHQVMLLPIDSEHYALWQLLVKVKREDVLKIAITASGGALRELGRRDLDDITAKDALNHPNWSMGPKITIDSATMVNKGLEVIEAHHLFSFPYDQIETILHDESLVHAIVYLKDGTEIKSVSANDMKIPIAGVLYFPNESKYEPQPISVKTLTFKPMDLTRYPMLQLAYEAGKSGGIIPTIYNASNEAAVDLFLRGKIKFREIESIIIKYTLSADNIINPTLEEILSVDQKIKNKIYSVFDKE